VKKSFIAESFIAGDVELRGGKGLIPCPLKI